MLSLLKKVKYWGLKGVVNHFGAQIRKASLRRYFFRNLKKYPTLSEPERGFTIIAPFRESYSLCKMARDLVWALHKGGIPYQTFDLSEEGVLPDDPFCNLLTPKKDFILSKYSHVLDFVSTPLQIKLPAPLVHCHMVFWEFDSGLLEYYPATSDGAEVITFSDYNKEIVQRLLSPEKVHKILYPFHFDPIVPISKGEMRKRFGFKEDDFVVFNNFDYNSSFFRKNPLGALQAFASAFAKNEKAHLLFKTTHASQHPGQVEMLKKRAKELGVASRTHFIDGYFSHGEIYSLTAMADAYLFLHRGEGFGLGVAEAVHLGVPAIVTDYSATREFCTPKTAILIPVEIKEISRGTIDNPSYAAVTSYPEPDVEAAMHALLELYAKPELRERLKRDGADFMQTYFSIDKFVASVRALLQ